jgi:hypothetical protein
MRPSGIVDYLCASVAGFFLTGVFGFASMGLKNYGATTFRPGPSKGMGHPASISIFKKGYARWTQIRGRRNKYWNDVLDFDSTCDMTETGLLCGVGGLTLACLGTSIVRSREEEDSLEKN